MPFPQNPYLISGYLQGASSGVTVRAINAENGETQETLTESDGSYIIDCANFDSGYVNGNTIFITSPIRYTNNVVIIDTANFERGKTINLKIGLSSGIISSINKRVSKTKIRNKQGISTLSESTKGANIGYISSINKIGKATQLFNNTQGALPLTSSVFTTQGGNIILFVSGSIGSNTPLAWNIVGFNIYIDGILVGQCKGEIAFTGHDGDPSFSITEAISNILIITGISSGQHTLTLNITGFAFSYTNSNCYYCATVLELTTLIASQVISLFQGQLPIESTSFNSNGETLLICSSGSLSSPSNSTELLQYDIQLDNITKGSSSIYTRSNWGNCIQIVPNPLVIKNIISGSHKVKLILISGNNSSNNIFNSSIIKVPSSNLTQIFNNQPGALPLIYSNLNTYGGDLICIISASTYYYSSQSLRVINIKIDGVIIGKSKVYNSYFYYMSHPVNAIVIKGILAGQHIISLEYNASESKADSGTNSSCFFSLTVIEV